MDVKLMNVKLVNVRLFFACGTALILWPLFSFQAQARETLSKTQHENAEIVRELLLLNGTQFTAPDISSSRSFSSPRIIVRCDHLTRYEHENRYESEDFFENADGQSRRWEHQQQHSAQSRSSIREILRDRTGSRSLIIEIQGQCNDIRLQVEPPSSLSHPPLPLPYPHSSQPSNTDQYPDQYPDQYLDQHLEQYQDWYENQITEGNIP